MKIREVMQYIDLPERTIRYYEERGLIHPKTMRNNGRTNHDYSQDDVHRLNDIVVLRRAQFSIDEINAMQRDPSIIPMVLSTHHSRVSSAKSDLQVLYTLGRFSDKHDWIELASAVKSCLTSMSGPMLVQPNTSTEEELEQDSVISAYQKISIENKAHWDASSDNYAAFNGSDRFLGPILNDPSKAFHNAVFQKITNYFPSLNNINICVPSSGDNHAVFAFAMLGAKITSCDISEIQLDHAKKIAKKHPWGKSIEFICTDTMTLQNVPSDKFDFVFTSNGVHVWLPDLNAMYQNIHRVLKTNGLYLMYELHPFLRPFDRIGNVIKPYDITGPFHDDDGITFAWRVMDFVNAISQSGFSIEAMDELYAEKDYDWPFWLSYDEIEHGAQATPTEFDYMFDWKNNPMAALPNWITISARKQHSRSTTTAKTEM